MILLKKISQLILKLLYVLWKILLLLIVLSFCAISMKVPLNGYFWSGYLCVAIGEYFNLSNKTIRLGKYVLTPKKIDKITLTCFIIICIVTLFQYPEIVKRIIFHNSQL